MHRLEIKKLALTRNAVHSSDWGRLAALRGQARAYRIVRTLRLAPYLWERACPRRAARQPQSMSHQTWV